MNSGDETLFTLSAGETDKSGDFRLLVNAHSRPLYAHIRSIVLDHESTNDVLQNTFLKAWQSYPSFRGDSKVSTWLFRIATNEALQHLRKRKTREVFSRMLLQHQPQQQTDAHFNSDDIRKKLESALNTLTTKQRMIFGMKYFNEMKYSEISEILKLSEGTLKAVYHHASRKVEAFILRQSID